jgi:hypothetical protein
MDVNVSTGFNKTEDCMRIWLKYNCGGRDVNKFWNNCSERNLIKNCSIFVLKNCVAIRHHVTKTKEI